MTNCQETRAAMDGYLDGELDLVRSLDLERHVSSCPDCAEILASRRNLRTAIREKAPRYRAPEHLRLRVHDVIAQSGRPQGSYRRWAQFAAIAAGIVVAVAMWVGRPTQDPLERELVASHVRSLMAGHLLDVPSTDQHTVKPWFAGKLDFSPPVTDHASEGFKLIGGRLDYIGDRTVAALVYQRGQHMINVFVWPGTDRHQDSKNINGYNVVRRTNSGMELRLVSDLNRAELEQLAALLTR